MKLAVKQRAASLFTSARDQIIVECKAMHAQHSARGLLGSSVTAKRAIGIYEAVSRATLNQILAEVANRIEHRGQRWTTAMADVRSALEEHIAAAAEPLEPSFKVARLNDAVRQALGTLIDDAGDALRSELDAFAEGWTAPQPKKWNERHPLVYAILLLVAGAIIGAAVHALG
jgi:hypothetical protein